MRTVAIIQARMASTRLPGKILMPICGKPMLELLVERLKHCKKISEIVIATSTNKLDQATIDLAKKINCSYFVGDEDNVLDRFYKAATENKADVIVRITGDCPLHDPVVVDEVIDFYLKNQDKYDYVSNVDPPTYPDGMDLWVFPLKTLKSAWEDAKLSSEREHVCPYIWKNPDIFKIGHYESDEDHSDMRWTVDDQTDFDFAQKIFEHLYKEGQVFHMPDILDFLSKNPRLHDVQAEKIRDEGYFQSLKED